MHEATRARVAGPRATAAQSVVAGAMSADDVSAEPGLAVDAADGVSAEPGLAVDAADGVSAEPGLAVDAADGVSAEPSLAVDAADGVSAELGLAVVAGAGQVAATPTRPAGRWPYAEQGPIEPGTGWPGDLATWRTPVATTPATVETLAATSRDLGELGARVSVCRACPRLVAWREDIAKEKRKSYATERYWGRPIVGWGDPHPSILIVGLAPAAHGGNRTGRVFTGDRSGDWLFASLHRVGLARQPTSVHAGDGQELYGARMVAAVRCAPPDNKPTTQERDACAPWLDRELRLIEEAVTVVVALGGFAWQATFRALADAGWDVPKPRPVFGHGVEVPVRRRDGVGATVIATYHPSQQNTFTGRLTEQMQDAVLARARHFADAAVAGG